MIHTSFNTHALHEKSNSLRQCPHLGSFYEALTKNDSVHNPDLNLPPPLFPNSPYHSMMIIYLV